LKLKIRQVIAVVLISAMFMLAITIVPPVKADDTTFQSSAFLYYSGVLQPAQESQFYLSIVVWTLAKFNVSIYSNAFEIEPNWTSRWIVAPNAIIGSWKKISFGITPNAVCYNRSYGITAIGWWNGSLQWESTTFFDMNGTIPWTDPASGHNYAAPDHLYISRDNFPDDLYLPIEGRTETVWFKWITNETMNRIFYMSWSQGGKGESAISVPVSLFPNVESHITFWTGEQIYGGTLPLWVGVSETDADAHAGIYVDQILVNVTEHCPLVDSSTVSPNSPPAVLSYQGLPCDVNEDGVINMKDIAIDVALFTTNPNSPNWNYKADVNGDNKIDMRDIAILVLYFNAS
jgi:hypothetical protein